MPFEVPTVYIPRCIDIKAAVVFGCLFHGELVLIAVLPGLGRYGLTVLLLYACVWNASAGAFLIWLVG